MSCMSAIKINKKDFYDFVKYTFYMVLLSKQGGYVLKVNKGVDLIFQTKTFRSLVA